jgi:hypothetical protein
MEKLEVRKTDDCRYMKTGAIPGTIAPRLGSADSVQTSPGSTHTPDEYIPGAPVGRSVVAAAG